jgi:hypothetical protein
MADNDASTTATTPSLNSKKTAGRRVVFSKLTDPYGDKRPASSKADTTTPSGDPTSTIPLFRKYGKVNLPPSSPPPPTVAALSSSSPASIIGVQTPPELLAAAADTDDDDEYYSDANDEEDNYGNSGTEPVGADGKTVTERSMYLGTLPPDASIAYLKRLDALTMREERLRQEREEAKREKAQLRANMLKAQERNALINQQINAVENDDRMFGNLYDDDADIAKLQELVRIRRAANAKKMAKEEQQARAIRIQKMKAANREALQAERVNQATIAKVKAAREAQHQEDLQHPFRLLRESGVNKYTIDVMKQALNRRMGSTKKSLGETATRVKTTIQPKAEHLLQRTREVAHLSSEEFASTNYTIPWWKDGNFPVALGLIVASLVTVIASIIGLISISQNVDDVKKSQEEKERAKKQRVILIFTLFAGIIGLFMTSGLYIRHRNKLRKPASSS